IFLTKVIAKDYDFCHNHYNRKAGSAPWKSRLPASATLTREDFTMATATVTETTPTRKPNKAYFATFLGLSGAIVKPADHIVFIDAESGATITLTEADYANLTV